MNAEERKAKSTKLKVGGVVTGTVLRNRFDRHVISVLDESYLQPLEREKRQLQKYKVVKELPEIAEYNTMRDKKYTTTINDALDDARSEIESLKDELDDWYDNLPESFQNGDKGQMLMDAVSQLENCDVPEAEKDNGIADTTLVILPPNNKSNSRAARRDDIAYYLSQVSDWIDNEINGESAKYTDDIRAVLEELHTSIDNVISELESVEFPGMY